MLRNMRNDFKKYSWTLWVVIFAFLIGFSLTDIFSGGGPARETDLLTINGSVIKGEEFQKKLAQTIDNYRQQFKQNFNKGLVQQLRIPEQILQTLINAEVISSEADKYDITISDNELRQKILSMPNFQRDGKFIGVEEYKRFLGYNRIEVPEFENELKKDIKLEKFKELVTAAVVMDTQSLKDTYKKEKDTAEIEYILLRPDQIKDKINVTDQQMSEYYDQNQKEFMGPEKRAGQIIAYNFEDFKKEVVISDQELYAYFKKNKRDFVTEGKTKVSRIFLKYTEKTREQVLKQAEEIFTSLSPENFSQKAVTNSQDKSAQKGGDWGYQDWQSLSKQEIGVIENNREKHISSPIDTGQGFAILHIPEKVEKKQQPFDIAKDKIKNLLEKEMLEKLVREKLNKIYSKVRDSKDLKSSGERAGVKTLDTGLLASGEAIKGIDEMGYLSRNLFSLKEKEISYPVEYFKGIAIVQLTRIKKPEIEKFDLVKEKVKNKLVQNQKIALLKKKAEMYADKITVIKDQKQLENYLKKEDLKFETLTYKRGNKLSYLSTKPGLDEIIFSLRKGQISRPLVLDPEIVLVKAKEVKISSDSDFNRDRKDFYNSKVTELKNNYFISYILNKRKNYEIRMNEELFTKIKDFVFSRL